MKILMVECTAEELKANRTVMDVFNEALSNFTRPMFGVDVDVSKLNCDSNESEEDEGINSAASSN